VLHAEPERRALLRRAEHVRGLDVDPVLAETIRGPGERARLVREPYFDDLAVARDAVLLRLDRAASLRRVLVVDDDVDRPCSAAGPRRARPSAASRTRSGSNASDCSAGAALRCLSARYVASGRADEDVP